MARGSGPSQRQLRVGELVRHAMSDILSRGEVDDPALKGVIVTVPEVQMSPDLRLATCYVMPLGDKDPAVIVAALERHKKYLRGEVGHRVELRYAPEVRFRVDTSFETGARIDALLQSPEVRRDIEADDDSGKA